MDNWAPYAPPASVLVVLHYYREREVPELITLSSLMQIGVKEAIAPRALATLRFLNLVEADGLVAKRFHSLRYASESDYESLLSELLRAAYKRVFDRVDVAVASAVQVKAAFHPYRPGAQRDRMITLFLALCREAGMALASQPKRSSIRQVSSRDLPITLRGDHQPTAPVGERDTKTGHGAEGDSAPVTNGMPDPAILAWFQRLPNPGLPWAPVLRKKWLKVLASILDSVYAEAPPE
jgi:hypothetical protein